MKLLQKVGTIASIAVVGFSLVGCGSSKSNTTKSTSSKKTMTAALVTGNGGVDDKSYNQSGWEGLVAWGKKNGLKKGVNGYNYAPSDSDADFTTNINKLIQAKYQVVIGIGYKLKNAIQSASESHPNTNFILIDENVKQKNVASVTFQDNEAAFLVGVAAAKSTKTKKVGFIGGQRSSVLEHFEAGYTQGVHSVDKSIKVDVKYAESFTKPDVGQALAQAMFNNDTDVIYQAAGSTGNGVFTAAKNQIKKKKVWVIGADRDQTEEGKYSGGSLTLTSSLKGVAHVVEELLTAAQNDRFPGGKLSHYGLKDQGVGIARGNLTDDAWKTVQDYKKQIIDGKIKVVEARDQLK